MINNSYESLKKHLESLHYKVVTQHEPKGLLLPQVRIINNMQALRDPGFLKIIDDVKSCEGVTLRGQQPILDSKYRVSFYLNASGLRIRLVDMSDRHELMLQRIVSRLA